MDASSRHAELSPDEKLSYAPLAPLAVVALGVSVLSALLIAGLWVASRASGKPIFQPALLVPALVGLILALVAGRQIRSSEATMSGRGLARAALWIAALTGLIYGAYLFAVDLAIRNQASQFTTAWIVKASAEPVELGFLMCLEPDTRQPIDEKDIAGIHARFDQELAVYGNSEIVRLIQRAGDQRDIKLRGIRDWSLGDGGYIVQQMFNVRTPEGEFDLMIPAFGRDTPALGGRTWQVLIRKADWLSRQYTALGRLMVDLQSESRKQLVEWMRSINSGDIHDAFLETLPLAQRASFKERMDSPAQRNFQSGDLIRVDGKLPTDEQRKLFGDALLRSQALNLFPGSAANPVGAPKIVYAGDRVTLKHQVEITPTEGATPVVAYITVEVQGEQLVSELLRLKNDNQWRQQSTVEDKQVASEIARFASRGFRVVSVDVRPNEKRLAQPGPGQGR